MEIKQGRAGGGECDGNDCLPVCTPATTSAQLGNWRLKYCGGRRGLGITRRFFCVWGMQLLSPSRARPCPPRVVGSLREQVHTWVGPDRSWPLPVVPAWRRSSLRCPRRRRGGVGGRLGPGLAAARLDCVIVGVACARPCCRGRRWGLVRLWPVGCASGALVAVVGIVRGWGGALYGAGHPSSPGPPCGKVGAMQRPLPVSSSLALSWEETGATYGTVAPVIPPPPPMRQGGGYTTAPAGVIAVGVVVGGDGGDVWRCGTRHAPASLAAYREPHVKAGPWHGRLPRPGVGVLLMRYTPRAWRGVFSGGPRSAGEGPTILCRWSSKNGCFFWRGCASG